MGISLLSLICCLWLSLKTDLIYCVINFKMFRISAHSSWGSATAGKQNITIDQRSLVTIQPQRRRHEIWADKIAPPPHHFSNDIADHPEVIDPNIDWNCQQIPQDTGNGRGIEPNITEKFAQMAGIRQDKVPDHPSLRHQKAKIMGNTCTRIFPICAPNLQNQWAIHWANDR